MKEKLILYTDGGSRGNPGPAAIGFVIEDGAGVVLKKHGEAIGRATNNEAEYRAVVAGLVSVKALLGKKKARELGIIVRMDSELVAKQLNGEYKIEEERLFPFFIKIWNLKIDFGSVLFEHVPREKNRGADRMVNEALDKEQGGLF